MADKINTSIFHVYSPNEKVGLSTFSAVIFAVAVPVNLYVLFAYLRSNQRRPSDLLQMNLTLSQFLNALLTIPLQNLMHVMKPELAVDGGTLCQITGILPYPLYIITIETMVFMSVDKLKAVKSPLTYAAKMTRKRMKYIVLFTWAHAVTFTIILVVFTEVGYNKTRGECAIVGENQKVVLAIIGVTHVTIPFMLLLLFYCKLTKFLRRHNRQMLQAAVTQDVQEGRRRNMVNQARERRVSCMILWIITIYLLTWIPPSITVILQCTIKYPPPIIFALAVLILHINEIACPVLHLIFMKHLHYGLARFCLCWDETSTNHITTSRGGS